MLLAVFLVAGQLFLPGAVEWGLETALMNTYPQVESGDVRLTAFPAVKLLAGRMDSVYLRARGIALGPVRAEALDVRLKGAGLDLKKLLLDREILLSAVSKKLAVTLTEQDINRYLQKNKAPLLRRAKLSIGATDTAVSGKVTLVGQELQVKVTGGLTLENGSLVFRPERVAFNGRVYAKTLQRRVLGRVTFTIPLARLPVKATFTELRQIPGKITLISRDGTF